MLDCEIDDAQQRPSPSKAVRLFVLALCLLLLPAHAFADEPAKYPGKLASITPRAEPSATYLDISTPRSFGWFFAGALTAFFAHEGGHLFGNFLYGNMPTLEGLWCFDFIPFVAISPRIQCRGGTCHSHDGEVFHGGPRGKLVITSGGFNVQHLTDEIMLTRTPDLRHRYAPFRKGMLAFNTLLSVGYSLSAFLRIEDPHGDVTRSAPLAGISPDVYATLLILPALLDIYRYTWPESRWAPWVSRGAKGAFLGVVFAAPH